MKAVGFTFADKLTRGRVERLAEAGRFSAVDK